MPSLLTKIVVAVAAATASAVVAVAPASGAYGEHYGMAPINGAPGATDTVPALPGYTHAFWAGTCDRATAPGFGDPIAAPGIGARPDTIEALRTQTTPIVVPAPMVSAHCIDWDAPADYPDPDQPRIWSDPPSWRLTPEVRAGAHADGSSLMAWNRAPLEIDGSVDNIVVDLPPGFVGNPEAVAKCTAEQFAVQPPRCPPESQVGVLELSLYAGPQVGNHASAQMRGYPVWNLEPRKGNAAELGFAYASSENATAVRLVARPRTASDNGVTAFIGQIPAALPPIMQTITLWGVPWEAGNDLWRTPLGLVPDAVNPCLALAGAPDERQYYIPPTGLIPSCQVPYDSSWGPIKPFLSNETDCNQNPVTTLRTDAFQFPGSFTPDGEPVHSDPNWKTYTSPSPAVTGCESLDFEPDIEFEPSSSGADGASGLGVELSIPQKDEAPFGVPAPGAGQSEIDGYVSAAVDYWRSDAGRAVSHLKDTVVVLPAGVSVNPSTATGLQGCTDVQVGLRELGDPPLFNNQDPLDGQGPVECPQGSVLGTVEVETPLLEEKLSGHVVLGAPKSINPGSGEMFRMFLVIRNRERGLLVKIYGSAKTDPATGQITAAFRNNPELPFDRLSLDFKGGSKGVLAMPQRCGSPGWSASFTPWSSVGAASPVGDVPDSGQFAIGGNCGFGFGPSLAAGMDTQTARGNGQFSFRFARKDGEQWLRGLTAKLPTGLLASVRDVQLCSNAQADAGSCPAGSRIGTVDAKAGSGDPFVLERKGEVFLTEGYKGGPYGLAVKIRPVAGPFRGAMELSPIVVRQAIHVDRTTAQVTAISDPFPLIHHGVPLRVREVTVLVDRSGFMLNPSDCEAKQVGADIRSAQGTVASRSNRFQALGCAALAFKPKLTLALSGRNQVRSFKHPGIRAQVTQAGVSEAGIENAKVTLPKSLALDVNNAQALCEFEDGTKPDLENRCPKGSIVGRARAVSPLLNDPLVGNVYFVKNIRRDPKTGNVIRTLPMVIAALRGEIAINLVGESSVDGRNRLVSTFASVPDAPVSKFNMNIKGGANGIIAVTRTKRALINLCAKPRSHVAEADIDGHNGRRHDTDIRMTTPCTRKQVRNARNAAKRAAQARKAAVRRS